MKTAGPLEEQLLQKPTLKHFQNQHQQLELLKRRELKPGASQKLAGMLFQKQHREQPGFGSAELDQMAEDGAITVTCEFCNVDFRFDRGDVGAASPADGGAA